MGNRRTCIRSVHKWLGEGKDPDLNWTTSVFVRTGTPEDTTSPRNKKVNGKHFDYNMSIIVAVHFELEYFS